MSLCISCGCDRVERVPYCETGKEKKRWGYGWEQDGACYMYEGSNIDWRVKDKLDDRCNG